MTTLTTPAQNASLAGQGPLDEIPCPDATQHRPVAGWQKDHTAATAERTRMAGGATSAAVDVMALLGRCLGNFELIVLVLSRFRKTGSADIVQLEVAIDHSDYAAVVEIAHRFKGASGNISATVLHKIAASMEQCARDKNADELPGVLSQLRAEWTEYLRFADAFAPPGG